MFLRVIIYIAYLLFFAQNAKAQNKKGVTLFAQDLKYDEGTQVLQAAKNVILVNDKYIISANQMIYDSKEDQLEAIGNVLVQDNYGNFISGNKLIAQNNFQNVVIDDMSLKLSNNVSLFAANRGVQNPDGNIDVEYGCYTACSVSKFKNPIWQIKAKHIHIDVKKERAVYKNVHFEVFGVPVMFFPYFVYPTPKAKAKSGILAPSVIDKGLRIPFYFRSKTNFDATITPRIVSEGVILEGQIRHLIKSGSYKFDGSIFQSQFIKKDSQNKIIQDDVLMRYHLFGQGSFNWNNINTGFDIKRVSDPAYIRKYYNLYDPYFESNAYVQNINYANYTKVRGLYFQDMRNEEARVLSQDQFALPDAQIKRFIPFEYGDLTVDSNAIFYKSGKKYEALRFANIFNIYKAYDIGNNLVELNLYDKLDFYKYSYDVALGKDELKSNSSFIRNVSEVHIGWRYPLVFGDIIIEPVAFVFSEIGKNKTQITLPIDSENEFEINDLNVMSYNKYSGLDNCEKGKRLSYGVNFQKIAGHSLYTAFLGKTHTKISPDDLVGSLSVSDRRYELYYRFSLSNKIRIKMHELGFTYNINRLDFSSILFGANKTDDRYMSIKKISNLTNKIKYRFNENWSLDFGANFDVTNQPKFLARSFGVTYDYDCVRISAGISDNFTQDLTRNIKASKSNKVFLIGLKTINM